MAANHNSASVTATQVGSYFVQRYYQFFQQQRENVHQFYNESSTMVRVDGDISYSASHIMEIHQLIMSLNFTAIEIKTINSIESWRGGILVVVSGLVKSHDFRGGRKFVQTFFLAPQQMGYYVLNDMFHFADEELQDQPSASFEQEQNIDYQRPISAHLPDPLVSDYPLAEETGYYVNSVHVEPALEYSYQDHHEQEPEPEPKLVRNIGSDKPEEETPFQDLSESTVTALSQIHSSATDPLGEPERLTYASILRVKGNSTPPISISAAPTKVAPPAADWNYVVHRPLQESASSQPSSGLNTAEDSFSLEEGESQSVYVRNLPSTVTSNEIFQEFTNFGNIKHDGVFLKNIKDTDVCYAFVEFEDVLSVRNAIKASPIQFTGRKVYIEERRANSGASRGGRSGGRSRGGRGRSNGRGSDQYGSDYYRVRTNGYHS